MADAGSHARWQSALRNPDNSREIWLSMLAAADPALTEAVVQMRRVLALFLDSRAPDYADAVHPGTSDRARTILARITVEDASGADRRLVG